MDYEHDDDDNDVEQIIYVLYWYSIREQLEYGNGALSVSQSIISVFWGKEKMLIIN